ncbi:unnamed protein product [Mucor hiemalis]
MSSSPFPNKADDPFNSPQELINDANASWQPENQSTSTIAPRWQLLTDQEMDETNKVINKLESKLKSLERKKDKPQPNYTNQIIPTHHLSDSEEEEDGEHEYENDEEVEEGVPLLWNSSNSRNEAPRKTEDQYNKWWFSLFCCCK